MYASIKSLIFETSKVLTFLLLTETTRRPHVNMHAYTHTKYVSIWAHQKFNFKFKVYTITTARHVHAFTTSFQIRSIYNNHNNNTVQYINTPYLKLEIYKISVNLICKTSHGDRLEYKGHVQHVARWSLHDMYLHNNDRNKMDAIMQTCWNAIWWKYSSADYSFVGDGP